MALCLITFWNDSKALREIDLSSPILSSVRNYNDKAKVQKASHQKRLMTMTPSIRLFNSYSWKRRTESTNGLKQRWAKAHSKADLTQGQTKQCGDHINCNPEQHRPLRSFSRF